MKSYNVSVDGFTVFVGKTLEAATEFADKMLADGYDCLIYEGTTEDYGR